MYTLNNMYVYFIMTGNEHTDTCTGTHIYISDPLVETSDQFYRSGSSFIMYSVHVDLSEMLLSGLSDNVWGRRHPHHALPGCSAKVVKPHGYHIVSMSVLHMVETLGC